MNYQDEQNILVLKIGGRTLLGADGELSETRISNIIDICEKLINRNNRLVVIVGGAGAHHFIDAARQFYASDGECDEIGIAITNVAARIMLIAFKNSALRIFPAVVTALDVLDIALENHNLTVVGSLQGATVSSDSTAAIIAEHVSAKLLLIVKEKLDIVHRISKGQDNTEKRTVFLVDLMEMLQTMPEKAGYRPIMDFMALRILQRTIFRTYLVQYKSLGEFHLHLSGAKEIEHYEIIRSQVD